MSELAQLKISNCRLALEFDVAIFIFLGLLQFAFVLGPVFFDRSFFLLILDPLIVLAFFIGLPVQSFTLRFFFVSYKT